MNTRFFQKHILFCKGVKILIDELLKKNSFSIHQHSYWNPIEEFQLSHDTYPHWSFFCIEEGEMEYKYLDTTGIAKFGDIIVCPPQYPLFRRAVSPLKFHFFQASADSDMKNYFRVGVNTLQNLERLKSTYNFFAKLSFSEDEYSKQVKAHLIYDISIQLLIENELFILEEEPQIKDEVIVDIITYINNNFEDKISFQELAEKHRINSSQLTRRFMKQVGVNPIDYLTMVRLRLVRTLLIETTDNLDVIAEKCGFQNGFYLSRKFKKIMNISPSEFRKVYRM
ncbi:AraC family transcriptional regulator [Lysinibacillus telephonicus]|uniref:AraC family transcriptional regulator n=1 Tax=Lysinibacillus telephonicus TaxID=1714840 RepID=A0A431UHC5_9BACI|nr:AraC family transcriptional regulator [Lysinibacillus telephonicus]